MNDFYDAEHSLPELIIQGHFEQSIDERCDSRIVDLVEQWSNRNHKTSPGVEAFKLDDTQSFVITHQGESSDHWPDAKANAVAESLIRDVLFTDGICNITEFAATLYQINFKVIAMVETEYLLVLPFQTESENIAGLAVVCVNHYVREET